MRTNKMKIIAYTGMIALLISLVLSLLGFSNYTRDIEHIKNQLLNNHVENNIELILKYIRTNYGTLTPGDQTLLDRDGNSIEGRFEVVDSILEDLGDQSTIFVRVRDDFKRISTNVTGDDGQRALGTYLGRDHSAYETVINGGLFVGEANVLGENFYTAYEALTDENDNVIGVLFVGIPTETLDNIIAVHDTEMGLINLLIIALRTISLGALILVASSSQTRRSDQSQRSGDVS